MGARTRGLANNVLTGGKIDATDGVSGVIDEANICLLYTSDAADE